MTQFQILLFVFLAIDINFAFVSRISQPFFRGIPKYMIEGLLGRVSGNEIELLVQGVKQCKPAMGVQEHTSPGNLKLKSSEITGNVYSFLHLQSFQEGQPSYTKWGHFA